MALSEVMTIPNNDVNDKTNSTNANQDTLLISIRPDTVDLHISLTESDIWSFICAALGNYNAVRKVIVYHHPLSPTDDISLVPSMPFAFVELNHIDDTTPIQLLKLKLIQKFNGINLPNIGTLNIYHSDIANMQKQTISIYDSYLQHIKQTTTNDSRQNIHTTSHDHIQDQTISNQFGYNKNQQPLSSAINSTMGHNIIGQSGNSTMGHNIIGQSGNSTMGQNIIGQSSSSSAMGHNNNNIGPSLNSSQGPSSSSHTPSQSQTSYYMARMELLHLFNCDDFNVTSAILGENNRNIHYILSQSDSKVSISIKGVPADSAPITDRLHISVQSNSESHFVQAVDMIENMLQSICSQYIRACIVRRIRIHSNTGFIRHQYVGVQHNDTTIGKPQYLGPVETPNDTWMELVPPDLLIHPNPVQPSQSNTGGFSNQPTLYSGTGGIMSIHQQQSQPSGNSPLLHNNRPLVQNTWTNNANRSNRANSGGNQARPQQQHHRSQQNRGNFLPENYN